jgi:hypothetical protein
MEVPHGASSRFVSFAGFRSFSPLVSSALAFPLTHALSHLVRWRQELEGRARERYGALDRLNTELSWYREQYDALDTLVEALRTADGWLAYQTDARPSPGARRSGCGGHLCS